MADNDDVNVSLFEATMDEDRRGEKEARAKAGEGGRREVDASDEGEEDRERVSKLARDMSSPSRCR